MATHNGETRYYAGTIILFHHGEYMVFHPFGYPTGQILGPNRDKGYNLCTSHPMVRPDTKALYICACDDIGDEGTRIFKSERFAKGHKKAYHFTGCLRGIKGSVVRLSRQRRLPFLC